jgi:hypothetical protein
MRSIESAHAEPVDTPRGRLHVSTSDRTLHYRKVPQRATPEPLNHDSLRPQYRQTVKVDL